jgi:sec-independent protein translocase protein TatA
MFGLGTPELIVILVIAFLIFGGKKLPEIGSGLGKALNSFKKGVGDVEEAGSDIKKSIPGVKEVTEVKDKIDQAKNITKFIKKI